MNDDKMINDNITLNIDGIIEGLLFVVGDDGITIEQLSLVLNESTDTINTIMNNLINKYQDDNSPIEIVNYGNKYKLLSKKVLHQYIEKLFQSTKSTALSQSAMETLAIIAYKQPITRVEIEEIRGVGCDMMLRKLQLRNMIEESGRSDAPGRPILYQVTEEFMDSFKLVSMDELPELPSYEHDENEELFES